MSRQFSNAEMQMTDKILLGKKDLGWCFILVLGLDLYSPGWHETYSDQPAFASCTSYWE